MSAQRRVVSVRHGRLKRPNPVISFLKLFLAVVAVIAVSASVMAGTVLYSFNQNLQNNAVELDSTPTPTNTEAIPQIGAFESGANILLVGSDSGGGNAAYGERDAALNDVTILIHLNASNTGITVISFPRDTFVDIPECSDPSTGEVRSASYETKINQALGRGGLNCVAKTVEQLTGLSIPYAAMVEFDGVVQMSNAIGGVSVCVSDDISDDYTGLYLTAGEHTLQGDEALAFLRTRHGVGDGSDLGRISNQQVFFSALARTIKSDATLTDISKLYKLAEAASSNVVLSTSLASPAVMVSFALALKSVPLDRIAFIQYPTYLGESDGQSGVFPSIAGGDLIQAVATDQPIALSGGTAPGAIGSIVSGTTPPDPTESPVDAVVLPPEVTGQMASQITCSNAN